MEVFSATRLRKQSIVVFAGSVMAKISHRSLLLVMGEQISLEHR